MAEREQPTSAIEELAIRPFVPLSAVETGVERPGGRRERLEASELLTDEIGVKDVPSGRLAHSRRQRRLAGTGRSTDEDEAHAAPAKVVTREHQVRPRLGRCFVVSTL